MTAPVLVFHGIATYVRGELAKIKDTEEKLAEDENSLMVKFKLNMLRM